MHRSNYSNYSILVHGQSGGINRWKAACSQLGSNACGGRSSGLCLDPEYVCSTNVLLLAQAAEYGGWIVKERQGRVILSHQTQQPPKPCRVD